MRNKKKSKTKNINKNLMAKRIQDDRRFLLYFYFSAEVAI